MTSDSEKNNSLAKFTFKFSTETNNVRVNTIIPCILSVSNIIDQLWGGKRDGARQFDNLSKSFNLTWGARGTVRDNLTICEKASVNLCLLIK